MHNLLINIKKGFLSPLDSKMHSEAKLHILAKLIDCEQLKNVIVKNLISNIPEFGKNFDWNVGSILQHLKVEMIIDILRMNKDIRLFNSIFSPTTM